jgi:hypothetical protein
VGPASCRQSRANCDRIHLHAGDAEAHQARPRFVGGCGSGHADRGGDRRARARGARHGVDEAGRAGRPSRCPCRSTVVRPSRGEADAARVVARLRDASGRAEIVRRAGDPRTAGELRREITRRRAAAGLTVADSGSNRGERVERGATRVRRGATPTGSRTTSGSGAPQVTSSPAAPGAVVASANSTSSPTTSAAAPAAETTRTATVVRDRPRPGRKDKKHEPAQVAAPAPAPGDAADRGERDDPDGGVRCGEQRQRQRQAATATAMAAPAPVATVMATATAAAAAKATAGRAAQGQGNARARATSRAMATGTTRRARPADPRASSQVGERTCANLPGGRRTDEPMGSNKPDPGAGPTAFHRSADPLIRPINWVCRAATTTSRSRDAAAAPGPSAGAPRG